MGRKASVRQWWRVAALPALLLVCLIAVAVRVLAAGSGRTTALPLAEVQDRFASSTVVTIGGGSASTSSFVSASPQTVAATSAATSTTMPLPTVAIRSGVYVYATTGEDSVDALNGASHVYPATTTVTVILGGCGLTQRWDVAVQRWEQWTRCLDGDGVRETVRVNYDEFFERGQTDTYQCDGQPRPLAASVGTVWETTCTQGEQRQVLRGQVLGQETRQVAGQAVDTTHVRVTIDNGNPSDSQVTDTWYQRGSDLIVAQSATNATTNRTVVGDVHYKERYTITLTSLEPSS